MQSVTIARTYHTKICRAIKRGYNNRMITLKTVYAKNLEQFFSF